jgi:uncharacterized SAM-binding protein YcdF (DUF218 family)
VELRDGAERYTAFMMLARQYPDATLVFTGGSGSLTKQEYKAADVAARLFKEQGLDNRRITFERESRNTYENALFSKKLVVPGENERWLLVTSAIHMPRSVGIFCNLGWPVIPYPVDHQVTPELEFTVGWRLSGHLRGLYWALHEWTGLLVYYLVGKSNSVLPEACL